MKLLLLLILSTPFLSAQECTYTLAHPPGGDTLVFYNGVLLDNGGYTMTGRTITISRYADGAQISYYYMWYRAKPQIYLPGIEYHRCTGNLNPPPVPLAVLRYQCIGSSATADCTGIELWKFTSAGKPVAMTAVAATPEQVALPACPASTPCWQSIP